MTSMPPFPDITSLWQETAAQRPVVARLSGGHRTDVAIIGGGYSGLSSARYLAARGLSCIVLEASRIGWGASGRNGGVVSGKFRLSFRDIAAEHGVETARRMHDLGIEAIDHVGELVEAYGIHDADFRATGSLRCAHNELSFEALRTEAAWLSDALGDRACSILSASEMEAETGSRDFCGGMLNRHGGVIHPLNFLLGLARGLIREGIDIRENSPVTGMRRDGDTVVLETPDGTVRADQVVIATDAYCDLTPATSGVRKSIIPFRSAMLATEPLTSGPGAGLLSQGRSYTETRRMMRWFRKTGDRLMYGGRGAFGKADSDAAFSALHKAMVRQFPELEGVRVTHRWSGLVAMTMDALPHLGRLDDRVVFALGYNGTGVAMASNIGRHVTALITGEAPDLGLITSTRLRPVPLYPVREPAVRLVAGWYQFLDAIGR